MSAAEAETKPVQTPLENNVKAADDVKKMLAELKDGDESKSAAETNGAGAKVNGTTDSKTKDDEGAEADKENDDTSSRQREDRDRDNRSGRSSRGGGGRGGRGGGGGRGDFKPRNNRDNIKSNLVQEEESSDPVAIRKQVEFYFSDSNLPMDKFLLKTVGGSKNNPVPLATLHSFKRMRHFQPFSAIVEAMKSSTFLDLIEDGDDAPAVRRKEPLPDVLSEEPNPDAVRVFEDKAMPASVYAKGFGDEGRGTQLDIEKFFEPHGPVKAVRLRRSGDMMFKGSVFVEFATVELAEKFLALDPKPQWNGKELQIMSKKVYCDQKVEDIKAGKIRANQPYEKPARGGGGARRGNRDDHRDGGKRKRDNRDDDDDNRDWRTRRDEDRKNGHRNDNKRGGRDRDDRRGRGPGFGAGRSNRRQEREVEVDESGIPVVKISPETQRTKDAIAKARKAVEDDQQQQQPQAEVGRDTQETKDESVKPVAEDANEQSATSSKKRERDDDAAEKQNGGRLVDGESEAKKSKVDDKA